MLWSIDPWQMVLYGLFTGLVFGFLLQKAHVTRYQVILGQFLFKDFTVLKVMLTAIVVGAIGIYGMRTMGMDIKMHVKEAALWGVMVGGLIFGVGMAVLGYCPGTGVAAVGDGSRHAIPGLLGMVVGAGLYAQTFPWVQQHLLQLPEWVARLDPKGKITLADVAHVSPWWLIAALALIAAAVFTTVERWERRRHA
jgi:uncharacterized membrane protein YedE/YeeE